MPDSQNFSYVICKPILMAYPVNLNQDAMLDKCFYM